MCGSSLNISFLCNPDNGGMISKEGLGYYSVHGFSEQGLRLELLLENYSDKDVELTFNIHWKELEDHKYFLAENYDYYYLKHETGEACKMLPARRKGCVNEITFLLEKGTFILSAVAPAYSLEDNQKYLETIRSNNRVEIKKAGKSEQGQDIHLISVSKKKAKANFLVVSRCHAYETAGNYNVEGMINFLLSGADIAEYLLERFNFYFVPMMNPDGVVNGLERLTDHSGADLNRDFECNRKINAGSENDQALVTHFNILDRLKPNVYLNLHNWSFKFEDGLMGFDEQTVECFASFMPDQTCDFKRWRKRVFGPPNGKTSPGRYCHEKYGSTVLVLEFPWYGRRLQRMRKIGEESLTVLSHIVLNQEGK